MTLCLCMIMLLKLQVRQLLYRLQFVQTNLGSSTRLWFETNRYHCYYRGSRNVSTFVA
ncbi:hypothetical protein Hanom_Chr03g00257541 [Helianthus anomalus]